MARDQKENNSQKEFVKQTREIVNALITDNSRGISCRWSKAESRVSGGIIWSSDDVPPQDGQGPFW